MKKRILITILAAVFAIPCFAITFNSVHTKYLIIGNGAPPPVTHGNDIGGFGGDTIGGFGGENIGGLP